MLSSPSLSLLPSLSSSLSLYLFPLSLSLSHSFSLSLSIHFFPISLSSLTPSLFSPRPIHTRRASESGGQAGRQAGRQAGTQARDCDRLGCSGLGQWRC